MKKTTLVAVMLLIVATAFATEKEKPAKATKKVAVINNNPQQFKLVYLDKNEGIVSIYLKNKRGQTIHYSKINNNTGFSQPYDLKALPEGDYTFEVTNPDGTSVKEKITLEKPKVEMNFVANVLNVNDEKKFRLAVVNKDKTDQETTIKLFDENNNLLHTESVKNLYAFRKIFDLSDLPGDSFKFAISNATGTRYLSAE